MQFDTGSAIVYLLSDKCTENCNSETKFKDKKPAAGDDLMGRVEYGYGSGYINGFVDEEKLSFSVDNS